MKYMTKQQKEYRFSTAKARTDTALEVQCRTCICSLWNILVYTNPAEAAETEAASPPQAEKVNQPSTTLTENIDQAPKNKQPETSLKLQNQQPKRKSNQSTTYSH